MAHASGLTAALVATTATQGLATFAVFILPVLAPFALRDLGVEPHWIGHQVAAIYIAAALVSSIAGGLVGRWGPARGSQVAVAAGAAGCVLIALGGLPGAVLGSVLIGAGYGLTNPAASMVLSRMTPAGRHNLVYGIKQMGVPFGAALAGLVLPGLAIAIGWRGAALAVAMVLLAMTLALGLFRPHWDAARNPAAPLRGAGGGLSLLRARPGLASVAIIGALYSAAQLALGAYAVTMLVEEFGWSPVVAGVLAAALQITGAFGRILWAWMADRLRSGLKVLAGLGLMTAAVLLPLPLTTGWPMAALAPMLCLLGLCAAGWNGVMLAEASRLAPPGGSGHATGAVLSVTFAGVVTGPTLFAAIFAAVGSYALAFAVLAALPLAGAAVAWRAHRRTEITPP
ncbi:MFS transporter [Plastoroseomonas hellenica]|uniref:MFS transporter n=1 Tax=Plastoroseomonas hellenica TaxID=2687306 RepID=UPI001BA63B21|nr:MFS transporter [Plastoroseomonas hellenica]MBR0642871.1 MFS transporter [Plastoroseomonas hellenica]